MATATVLPRWDLTPAFASPEAPELAETMSSIRRRLGELEAFLDAGGSADEVALVEGAIERANDVGRDLQLVRSYLYAWTTADTSDAAAAKMSALFELRAVSAVTQVKLRARIGRVDVDAVLTCSEAARAHEHFLRTAAIDAAHQMSLAEEELAARLRPGAGSAWERLRDDVSAPLTASMEVDGTERERPLAEIMNLASHPDRDVRRRAYEVENRLWRSVAVPVAASLNGVKNEALVLAERRGWGDPLDVALHVDAIDRPILDAMMAAMEGIYSELWAHMRRRARMLGDERLAWYDLLAPVEGAGTYTFDEARDLLLETVAPLSPRLEETLRRAFDERWIDAEPRPGKVGGAYCADFAPYGARVLMNFNGTLKAVLTLAHELGHAFHDICLAYRTPLQGRLPKTLAETASMFLQHMLEDVLLERSPDETKVVILNERLNGAVVVILNLRARFEFEQSLFGARRERALTVNELERLMLESQEVAYGDGLNPDLRAPMQWASRPHYYRVDQGYYNFPYQFGLLFGLALHRRYQEDPARFAEPYERMLSRTGMAAAAELAAEFGFDLRDKAFWASSLEVIREDIRQFAELTPDWEERPTLRPA